MHKRYETYLADSRQFPLTLPVRLFRWFSINGIT